MKNLYELRVAKVLSPLDLVINAGEQDGVTVGMTFIVYVLGEEIMDPETGKSLGTLEVVKGKVRVKQVQDAMCVAHTADTYERRIAGPSPFSNLGITSPNWEYETTDKPLKNAEVGDLVRRTS